MSDQNNMTQPKHTLSVFDVTAIIVGIVIGAGIFIFPSLVAMNAATPSWVISFWVIGGVVSLVGALCYAELATTYPNAGGDYFYLRRSYGNNVSFIFGWARMMVIQPGAIVMMAFVIGREITKVANLGMFSESIYAVAIVILLTAVNMMGIKEGKWAQRILTSLIVVGIGGLIIIGFFVPSSVPVETATVAAGAADPIQELSKVGLAMVFVLFTYGGWNESAYVSAEIDNPKKNIIKALLLGLGIVTVVYILLNLAYLYKLGFSGMKNFDLPQLLVERTLGGDFKFIVSIILCLAALSTTNATIMTGARSNYALGKDYKLFQFMGKWSDDSGTPIKALIFQGVIAIVLIILGTKIDVNGKMVALLGSDEKSFIEMMVEYTTPAFWFFFLLTGVSLIVLRIKDKETPRVFKVPLYPVIPILFISYCVFMLQSSIRYHGKWALVSVIVLVAGIPFILLNKFLSKDDAG